MAQIIPLHRSAAARPQGGSDSPKSRPASIRPTTVERTGNIRRYLTPSDLRSLTRDWDASIIEDRPDLYEALRNSSYRLTLGERLVAFGRRYGDALTFWLGMVALVLCCTIVASAVMGVGL